MPQADSANSTGVPASLVRRSIEDEIERLIGVLDDLDGDPDFEDGEDPDLEDGVDAEPSIGTSDYYHGCDVELDDCDAEPSLGSINVHLDRPCPGWCPEGFSYSSAGDQRNWSAGNRQDLEGDPHEDDEDTFDQEKDSSDDEWELGWTNKINQAQDNDGGYHIHDGEQMLASTPWEDATRLASRCDHDGEAGDGKPSPTYRRGLSARRAAGKPLQNIRAEKDVLCRTHIVREAR